VPRAVVAKHVRDDNSQWLARPGKKGQVHRDSDVRKFRDHQLAYKSKWELLNLG